MRAAQVDRLADFTVPTWASHLAQPITPSSVTPTDVVVTVSDLIRAAGLNLWDVSMWFNRKKG